VPLVWERVAPPPKADTSGFLGKFLPPDHTLGATCTPTQPATWKNPSFTSPSEATCTTLSQVFRAAVSPYPSLAGPPDSCGLAIYREGSEQVLVGIFHFLREGDASNLEAQLQKDSVTFIARRYSSVVPCEPRKPMRHARHEACAATPIACGRITTR
jgi:hypothetical protein